MCSALLCDSSAKALMENKRLIYTSPVKSLSNQKYAELKEKYGEQSVGLATGDNKVGEGYSYLTDLVYVCRSSFHQFEYY